MARLKSRAALSRLTLKIFVERLLEEGLRKMERRKSLEANRAEGGGRGGTDAFNERRSMERVRGQGRRTSAFAHL